MNVLQSALVFVARKREVAKAVAAFSVLFTDLGCSEN